MELQGPFGVRHGRRDCKWQQCACGKWSRAHMIDVTVLEDGSFLEGMKRIVMLTTISCTAQATRAGVYVGKLRSNTNKDIARAAAELVTKWKKLVEQEKSSKHKTKTGSPASGMASSPAAAPTSGGGSKKAYEGNPETRKYDTDKVDIRRTDSDVRNQCIGLLYNGLAFRSTESESDVIARAVAVENAAFSHFKGDGAEYKKKIRSLFANLKNKSNKELGQRVMSGGISADKFVVMTDEDLKSDDQRRKEIELEKENMKKAQVPMEEKSISDSLECGKCKKKKVSYTQAQTRSADEPMTTFCECMNCGNRWKVSFTLSFLHLIRSNCHLLTRPPFFSNSFLKFS